MPKRAVPRRTSGPAVDRTALALTGLIFFQIACAVFFVAESWQDLAAFDGRSLLDWYLSIEALATAGLVAGIAVETYVLRRMLARTNRAERAAGIAQGALNDLIGRYFTEWRLTQAEIDVAAFTIKGFSIAEIARFRGSAEGTIKTHLNAIYRKAGVAGRGQLVSLLIEDLLREPLVPTAPTPPGEAAPQGETDARDWRDGHS